MAELSPTITWVPFASLARLLLALLLGLFVDLEREWRGKEAGLRTHGLSALLGAMARTCLQRLVGGRGRRAFVAREDPGGGGGGGFGVGVAGERGDQRRPGRTDVPFAAPGR